MLGRHREEPDQLPAHGTWSNRHRAGHLVVFHSARLGRGILHTVVDGESGGISATGGGSGVLAEPRQTAATYSLRVTDDMDPRGRLALATYERID